MLSYRSNTYQTTRQELVNLQEEKGSPITKEELRDYVSKKGIDPKEWGRATREFIASKERGEIIAPPGIRPARILTGTLGEMGRDIRDLSSAFAPKTTKAIGTAISGALPDWYEKRLNEVFDPYLGNNAIDDLVIQIGSILGPGGVITKGITKGAKFIKTGKAIGSNAARLRKIGRLGKYAGAGAGATTIADSDIANEHALNAFGQLAQELGFEDFGKNLEKLGVDPNDTRAEQYVDAFFKNLGMAGILPVTTAALFTKPLTRKKAIERIAKKYKQKKDSVLEVDSVPTNIFSKTGRWLKRGFTGDRGLGKFTLERILMRERAGKKAIQEAQGLTQDLLRAVKAAASRTGVDKKIIDDKIQRVLELRDAQALKELRIEAPEVATIVNKMTKNIHNMRRTLSKHVEDPELKAIYDPAKKKVYLNRSYRIYDDPSFSRELKDIDPIVREQAEHYLRNTLKVPEEDIVPALRKLLARGAKKDTDFRFADLFGGSVRYGGGTSRPVKARTKLAEDSPEIRALWGEVKDPYKNYANTYEKLSKMESEYNFVNDMADYFRKTGIGVTEDDLFRKGITIGDKSDYSLEDVGEEILGKAFRKDTIKKKVLNPLENLYVNPEYKKFIQEGTDIFNPKQSSLMKTWMHYKVGTQTAKTIYNPSTHGRNTLGNMVLMVANGMNPFKVGSESFKAARNKLTGYSNEELGKKLGRYQELDIIDSGVKQESLRKAIDDTFNYVDGNKVLNKVDKALSSKKSPTKIAQSAYQIEDDFFKIMHFENTVDKLKKVFPKGTPIEKIEEEAAKRTRELMPNYGLVGRKLKELRYLPVGDFIAFPAEMIRVSTNLATRTLKDIKGDTARELEKSIGKKLSKKARQDLRNMGYKRLAGMTVAGTAGEQAMSYSAARLGLTSKDIKEAENLGADYERGSPKLFLSGVNIDKNNHIGIDYINLGPIDPFNYLKAPSMLVGRELAHLGKTGIETFFGDGSGVRVSDDFNSNLKAAFNQAVGPFLGSSMATDAIINAVTTAKEEGGGNYLDKSLKIGGILAAELIPGGYTMYEKGQKYRTSKEERKKFFNKKTGKSEERGAVTDYDYTIPEVEMEGIFGKARWFGIRPQRLDITAGMRRQILPLVKDMDRLSEVYKFMNNPNAPKAGPERNKQFREAYIKDQKERMRYFERLKTITDAYDQLGLDYEDIIMGLTKEGLKEVNEQDIINKMDFASRNQFMPSFVPVSQIPYAYEYTGGELPLDAISNLYERFFNVNIVEE
jgi:hypothetical protein